MAAYTRKKLLRDVPDTAAERETETEILAVGSDKTGDSGEMIQDFWPAG